jgi:hypothetical protein
MIGPLSKTRISYRRTLARHIAVAKRVIKACGAFSLCLLQACASTHPSVPTATDAEKRQAQHDFIKCALKHEAEVDDGVSDASLVALALTNRCINEYAAETDIWFRGSRDQQLIRLWKQERATPQGKIEASLEVVVRIRRGEKPNPNF